MADSTQRGTRIEFREITKIFKQKKARVKALDHVSMTIEPGEIVGIIGYSGAGKSTLVRMINGLDTPSAGELLLDDTNIVGMSEKKLRGIRRNIGMIFQQFNLMNSRTKAACLPSTSPRNPAFSPPPPGSRKPAYPSPSSTAASPRCNSIPLAS